MSRAGKWVLSMLLWTWGGAAYFLLEMVYKTATGHPEHISWTMLVLAMVLCIPIERCGAELPWEVQLPLQAFICAALVTLTELIAGLVLNVWLGLGVGLLPPVGQPLGPDLSPVCRPLVGTVPNFDSGI